MGRDSYSSRQLVEECFIISTKDLKPLFDSPNLYVPLPLTNSDEIGLFYKSDNEALTISYIITNTNEKIETSVYIVKQPCNYGGFRYYFACPCCDAMVYKLYHPSLKSYFACRQCHNLTYAKQKYHLKSWDMFRFNCFDRKIEKLIAEGKTRTIRERRKIRELKEKKYAVYKKYLPAIKALIGRLEQKNENNLNI